MADVFVSYKAEDRRRVKALVDALEADGFSVWWDAQIGGGAHWREDIQEQLAAARCVVVAWTKHSVGHDGNFVRDEASDALRRDSYLPIKLDDVDPPLGFREVQALLLKGWTGNRSDPRYQSVLEAVRSLVSGRPPSGRVHVAAPVFSRRIAIGGGAAVVAAMVASGWFVLRPKAASASNRIAVLPFANLSGDAAQAYFSDGIAEELRSSLARIGMQVIGRASCDAVRNLDIKAAAGKLGVANILTGSVRRSPQTIRINAQLVSGSDGVERWSQTYDRPAGDVLKVETDIAENVAKALMVVLGQAGRAALTIGGTTNPAAQDLFLQAIHDTIGGEVGIERRLALLDAALALDPNYAKAYAYKAVLISSKAAAYTRTAEANLRGQAEALALANRAISIAPKMAFGYGTRSEIYQQRLQFAPAFADAKNAVMLSGENGDALGGYALLLSLIGRFEEAQQLSAKALSLDPLSEGPYITRARILLAARRFPEAETSARRARSFNPDGHFDRYILGLILLLQGKFADAEKEFQNFEPIDWMRLSGEALIAARSGLRSQALDKLKALKAGFGDYDYFGYAQIHAQLGMNEEAFKELELAWQVRDPGLCLLRVDPFLDPIRADPRFAVLERKLDFPQSV